MFPKLVTAKPRISVSLYIYICGCRIRKILTFPPICCVYVYFKTKSKTAPAGGAQPPQAAAAQPGVPQQGGGAPVGGAAAANGAGAGQPDYSAQWAQYYRSIGKHEEAKAIEAQMKNKVYAPVLFSPNKGSNLRSVFQTSNGAQAAGGGSASLPGAVSAQQQQAGAGGYQQSYGGYQPNPGKCLLYSLITSLAGSVHKFLVQLFIA